MAELNALRAITFRISSTPTAQLPSQVPAIAASLSNCRSLLASSGSSTSKSASEASVAIHKFRTLLATLLQDRTVQGRWAAIVLIKSTIEVGGWETLSRSLPWVRGLLAILSKPDPPSTKKLCIITLTRIFILTREYQTLVREITTPSLPTYVQTCLQLAVSGNSAVLRLPVLDSFNNLLPRHPTIFRSYLKQLQPLLGQTLAPTPSNRLVNEDSNASGFNASSETAASARRLYVQLPCCAPKGGTSAEWEKSLKAAIGNTHRITNHVFRAVVEDWRSVASTPITVNGHTVEDQVQDLEQDDMGLPPWSGIYAGGERLVGLLRIIKEYLAGPTAGVVNVNIGALMDLLTRLFSLNIPSFVKQDFQGVKFNNQVSKDERECLWALLPNVHVAAIEVLLTLLRRTEGNNGAFDAILLDQLSEIFKAEKSDLQVRTACYLCLTEIVSRTGPTLPKSSIDSLGYIIRGCCEDVLPQEQNASSSKVPAQSKANGSKPQSASTNADAFLGDSTTFQDPIANFCGVKKAAHDLLPVLLEKIQPHHLPDSLRTRLDRTAILGRHKEAMLSSVLNPPPSKKFGKAAASILPLLARAFPEDKGVESLLRPRMPVLRTLGGRGRIDEEEEEYEEEDVDEHEDGVENKDVVDHDAEDNDHFVGEELDNILGTADLPATEDSAMQEAPPINTMHSPKTMGIESSDVETFSSQAISHESNNKRPQGDFTPLSPSKRPRLDIGQTAPFPVEDTTSNSSMAYIPAPSNHENSPPVAMVASTNIQSEAEPQTVEAAIAVDSDDDDDDDDDDDFGELTLGPDTDSESEANIDVQ